MASFLVPVPSVRPGLPPHSPARAPRQAARRLARFVAVALLLLSPAVPAGASSVPDGVDPRVYETFCRNVDELMRLQDPALSKWTPDQTHRMMAILEANEKLGLKLPRENEVIRIQNMLVENMHDHCRILSLAADPGAVLLRVGKTPENLAFGGLNTPKVSDFDETIVGRGADEVRNSHLALARERYGKRFTDLTLTNLALGDGTIAAWNLADVRRAYGTAMLDPEMHRTYSGLQFVEDYIISVGEISTLDETGTKLVTKNLDRDFKKNREAFIAYANELFERAGVSIRFGKREKGFCLGLLSDISNQMWMNVQKEFEWQKSIFGGGNPPENHVKKYTERTVAQLREAIQVDLEQDPAYTRVKGLIEACHQDPSRLDDLLAATKAFEARAYKVAASRQRVEYDAARAAGLTGRADAIFLDTEGALQNWSLVKSEDFHPPLEALGPLGHEATESIRDVPPFTEPSWWQARPPRTVMDRRSMQDFLKKNRTAIVMQVGQSLYAVAEAFKAQAEGDTAAVWKAAKQQALEGIVYNGFPMVLEYLGYSIGAAAIGWAPAVWGLYELGFDNYHDYLHDRLTRKWVEPRITARLAGVTPDGKPIGAHDVLSELGAGLTEADLQAPATYVEGTYNGGTVRVRRQENGIVEIEELDPTLLPREREWAARHRAGALSLHELSERPPSAVRSSHSYTPGELITQRRLSRVFDLLRAEYRRGHPSIGARDSVLDLRKMLPPYHLDEPILFERKVDRNEVLFYWKRFMDAVVKSQVQFNLATSVDRQAENGYALEVELGVAVTRKFLEEMGTRAAEADAAREAFDLMGPQALAAAAGTLMPLHVDGRDLTRAEVQARIDSMTARELRQAEAATPAWLEWLRSHWTRPELQVPDSRTLQCQVISLDARPDPETDGWYRLVLTYQLNRQPPGGIRFKLLTEGKDDLAISSVPSFTDPQCDGTLDKTGPNRAVFGFPADRTGGETRMVRIAILTTEADARQATATDRVLTTAGPVSIAGERPTWLLEGFRRAAGPDSFEHVRDGYRHVLRVSAGTGGFRVETRAENPDGAWDQKVLTVGPLPPQLVNYEDRGFLEILQTTSHPSTSQSGGRQERSYVAGFGLDFGDHESGWQSLGDSIPDVRFSGRTSARNEEFPKALLRSHLSAPEPYTCEDCDQDVTVTELAPHELSYMPPRLGLAAVVRVNEPGAAKPQLLRFEWTWRLARPGEILPTLSPLEMGGGPATASGAASGSSGATSLAGNPWSTSVRTANASAGPWGASLAAAQAAAGSGAPAGGAGVDGHSGAAGGGALTGEQMLASPAPWNYPQVQAALDEWLHSARPPIEDGTPWHYTEWGVMENGVNVRAIHPDNQGMTRHQYLWERCRRLTSVGHCTLGDYVRLRLTGGSLDACRGASPAGAAAAAGPARAPVSGEAAPLFVARTVDGKRTIRLEELRGRTVLLNLWNPGSPADRAQYAYLNDELGRLQQAGSGMVILSVAPSAGGLHPQLRDALAKVSLRIAELYPDSSVVVPYAKGLQATPATYVIDAKGIVRDVVVGSLKTNHAANIEIENLLGIGRR